MNPSYFLTTETLTHIPDRNGWHVAAPLSFYSGRFNLTITVPAGFETDLASVPRLVWFLIPPTDKHIVEPATVHDWLYANVGYYEQGATGPWLSRKQADRILADAIAMEKGPGWYVHIVYWGVRLGGWYPWLKHLHHLQGSWWGVLKYAVHGILTKHKPVGS